MIISISKFPCQNWSNLMPHRCASSYKWVKMTKSFPTLGCISKYLTMAKFESQLTSRLDARWLETMTGKFHFSATPLVLIFQFQTMGLIWPCPYLGNQLWHLWYPSTTSIRRRLNEVSIRFTNASLWKWIHEDLLSYYLYNIPVPPVLWRDPVSGVPFLPWWAGR